MLWELYQFSRIHQAGQAASEALGSAQRLRGEVGDIGHTLKSLELQVERLTLATIAMVEIMRDRHGVSEAEFEAKVREIDLRDGRLDGKLRQSTPPPRNCPSCGRPNGGTRPSCLYCSAPLPVDPLLRDGT